MAYTLLHIYGVNETTTNQEKIMKQVRVSKMTRQALEILCNENNCTIDELVDALMNNIVAEQISIQIHYKKIGQNELKPVQP
jgi:DNA-binding Xre family transcriptional regulator